MVSFFKMLRTAGIAASVAFSSPGKIRAEEPAHSIESVLKKKEYKLNNEYHLKENNGDNVQNIIGERTEIKKEEPRVSSVTITPQRETLEAKLRAKPQHTPSVWMNLEFGYHQLDINPIIQGIVDDIEFIELGPYFAKELDIKKLELITLGGSVDFPLHTMRVTPSTYLGHSIGLRFHGTSSDLGFAALTRDGEVDNVQIPFLEDGFSIDYIARAHFDYAVFPSVHYDFNISFGETWRPGIAVGVSLGALFMKNRLEFEAWPQDYYVRDMLLALMDTDKLTAELDVEGQGFVSKFYLVPSLAFSKYVRCGIQIGFQVQAISLNTTGKIKIGYVEKGVQETQTYAGVTFETTAKCGVGY